MAKILNWTDPDEQWDLVAKALKIAHRVYLWGKPGVGKSYLSQMGRDVANVTLFDDLSAQELLGAYMPAEDATWKFIYGPVIQCARAGGTLVLNELHKASPSVHDFLLSVLDSPESRLITLPSNGGTIRPPLSFKVVATANEGPHKLSKALQDRFEVILQVQCPNPASIKAINARIPKLGDLVRNSYKDNSEVVFTPRKALAYADLLDAGMTPEQAAFSVFSHAGAHVPTDFLNALSILQK